MYDSAFGENVIFPRNILSPNNLQANFQNKGARAHGSLPCSGRKSGDAQAEFRLLGLVAGLAFGSAFRRLEPLQLIEFGQDLAAVSRRVDAGVDLGDLSAGIDEESVAGRELYHSQIRERSVS